ncbi:MAG: ImmA/IrrE family metallo-endopeptidase [Cyanobacteria bacterium P01_H01_bin.35]
MTKTLTMSHIYTKLSKLGLNRKYVRENGLPSWWNDRLNSKPFAVLEGAGYIADRLNLDLKSLFDQEEVRFNPLPHTNFKQCSSKNKERPHVAQALASRIADLIASATELNFTTLPKDVKEIREEILTNALTINLTSLLEYCWSKGIIIAYFNHFPTKTKKFAALIQWQSSSPVIIISSKSKHSARLAFNLAHELGHLALGHLKEGVLVDEDIQSKCNDEEENQANKFATELLLDNYDNCLKYKRIHNHTQLIQQAEEKARENPTLEPDSIILNYGWHNGNWGFVNTALKKLDLEANGQQIVNEYLADRLDWDIFNDESYEYLEKVLGV